MGESGNDIIIKGGSVELQYDPTLYEQESGDPTLRKCYTRKIVQVLVSGDGLDYDSGNHPEGLGCTVRVVCR